MAEEPRTEETPKPADPARREVIQKRGGQTAPPNAPMPSKSVLLPDGPPSPPAPQPSQAPASAPQPAPAPQSSPGQQTASGQP